MAYNEDKILGSLNEISDIADVDKLVIEDADIPTEIKRVSMSDIKIYCMRGIDDSPVDGVTTKSISSNWAYDHAANITTIHLPDQSGKSDGSVLKTDGLVASWTTSIGTVPIDDIEHGTDPTACDVPTNLSLSETGDNASIDGTQTAWVILTWFAISDDKLSHYLIRYKQHSFTYYTYTTSKVNIVTIDGLIPKVSYDFGVASVNKAGVASDFCTNITETTSDDDSPPATVTGVSATGGIQYAIIEWDENSEADLAAYYIYRNTVDDSGTASIAGGSRTNYFIDGNRTGGTEVFYWVKAMDTSGNKSAAFSTVASCIPHNVTSDDVVTLAGSKVLIDGAVYLSNWRHSFDLTKIDGGKIYTSSITTSQLNFTPVQSTDVIASINASAEGITIEADNITISGASTFSSGYDPTTKVATLGGSYSSTSSGARVRIFPDANTGIQVIDDVTNDVFKALVGGTDVGDVIIGDYTGANGAKFDKSAGTFDVRGKLTANDIQAGGTITGSTVQTAASGVKRAVISGVNNNIQLLDAADAVLINIDDTINPGPGAAPGIQINNGYYYAYGGTNRYTFMTNSRVQVRGDYGSSLFVGHSHETINAEDGVFEANIASGKTGNLFLGTLNLIKQFSVDQAGNMYVKGAITCDSTVDGVNISAHAGNKTSFHDHDTNPHTMTIDGVDVSAHANNVNAHHAQNHNNTAHTTNYTPQSIFDSHKNDNDAHHNESHTLGSHSDVYDGSPNDGQYLRWDAYHSRWQPSN